MRDPFDVVIIGGGPAGSAAALTLRKRPDIRVLVLERSTYATPRAGEALSPGARSLLDYLGVWERFAAQTPLDTWGNQAAWGRDELSSLDFMFTVHGNGWSLDRVGFDRMLAGAAEEEGATVLRGAQLRHLVREREGWTLQYSTEDGTQYHATTRYVIDAAGRTSPWAERQAGIRQRHDTMIGLSGILPVAPGHAASFTTVEAVAQGWWYAAPVPGGRIVVTLMSDADIIQQARLGTADGWHQALAQTTHVQGLAGNVSAGAPTPFPAYSSQLLQGSDPAILAAGDAAMSHDPLSSSGIPGAIGTGIQAARVAADALFGKGQLRAAYLHSLQADYATYLKTRWRYYALERRWPGEVFWRRRQTALTLPPTCDVGGIAKTAQEASTFIPRPAVRTLKAASRAATAHEAVATTRAAHPDLPDERIILALQELHNVAGAHAR